MLNNHIVEYSALFFVLYTDYRTFYFVYDINFCTQYYTFKSKISLKQFIVQHNRSSKMNKVKTIF